MYNSYELVFNQRIISKVIVENAKCLVHFDLDEYSYM